MADSSEMNNLLENVEQLINDENRIVTYEFLSQTCGIHVNLAKTVLEKYVDNLKKKVQLSSYQVVYSLGGYVGKNLKFLLVRDINLEEAKSKVEKIISLHIYSIQKGKLEKFGVLYNSNITEIKKSIQQCCGQAAISCPAAKLKSPAEIAGSNVTEVQKNAEPVKPTPSNLKNEETSLDSIKTEDIEHTTQVKATAATAKEKTSSKLPATKGGKPAIAAFFATQQAIGRVNPVKEPAEKKVVDEEPKKSVTHKRLIRQSSDDESENENKDTNSEKVKPTKRFKLTEEPLKSQETKEKAKKPQKKAKQSKLSGKTQRKRIQQFSDSESNSDEEEEVILSSPEMPPQMPAPMSEDDEDVLNATVVEPKNNNKRSRKLVSKTFLDKNGYVVTTKEYETCEENEANENSSPKEKTEDIPKIETKPSVKHPSSPGKTKQKSITSFFTRK